MSKFSLLLALFPVLVFGQIPQDSKPRLDLYKNIKKKTNISLKEAYDAVFNDKSQLSNRLNQFADIKGSNKIVEGIQLEIESYKKECDKAVEKDICNQQINDLMAQKKFVTGLDQEVTKNPPLTLYKSLMIYSFVIRHEILQSSYESWTKECSNQIKVNTPACKKQFFETDILYSIAKDLTNASYSLALKTPLAISKIDLEKLVARYE